MAFESAHRAQPGFEPTVVRLDWIVRVLLDSVHGLRQQLIQHPRVARGPVGRDLYRRRAYLERLDEERPRRGQIPLDCQKDINHLAVLVDSATQVSPTTGDFDVGLIDEPTILSDVPTMPGGVDKFRCEALHPPIHRHMINGDAALSQQLLDIAIAQSVAQVLAHRYSDHFPRKAVTGGRRQRIGPDELSLPPTGQDQRNSAPSTGHAESAFARGSARASTNERDGLTSAPLGR